MKPNSIIDSAYPPLPPPPPPTPAKSRKTMIVALLLVLVIASALALAYMATGGFNFQGSNNTNPSPSASPSGFATASPTTSPTATATSSSSSTPSQTSTPQASQPTTSTSPTPQTTSSPDSTQAIANLRVGAWANYTLKDYDTDGITVTSEMHMKESIGEGSPSEGAYVGQNCWKISTDTDQTTEGETSTSTTIIYLAKNTMQGLRYEVWMNNQLIYGYDLNATSTTDPGTSGQIDPNTVISHETCTVPAGTFADCMKAKTTNTFEGITITSYMWAHQSVPVWGLVKSESYSNNVLTSVMELTAYGG